MRNKTRTIAAGFAALALAIVGLTGCSGGKSDQKACETIAGGYNALEAGLDFEEGLRLITEAAQEATEQAKSPELEGYLNTLARGFGALQYGEPTDEAEMIEVEQSFFYVGETCAALGVTIPGYAERKAELDAMGVSVEDLADLLADDGEDEDEYADEEYDEEYWENFGKEEEPEEIDFNFDFDQIEEELIEYSSRRGYYEDCKAGDMVQCDELYSHSPSDSELARFGDNCGGAPKAGFWCAEYDN